MKQISVCGKRDEAFLKLKTILDLLYNFGADTMGEAMAIANNMTKKLTLSA